MHDVDDAIKGLRAWLLMDPDDPAEAHYRLAKLLDVNGLPDAKKHVLAALEAAPRYREAQKLLLKIVRSEPADAERATADKPADNKRIRPEKVGF